MISSSSNGNYTTTVRLIIFFSTCFLRNFDKMFSGRLCDTQLLNTHDIWMSDLDNNLPTDVIYLDFNKAFDTAPHLRLINKLKCYGITGNT